MEEQNIDFIINGELYLKKNSERSHAGTQSFWQLLTKDDKLIILNRCDKTFQSKRVYSSIKNMKNDFIKLSDFLEKATFVGRKFKRTKALTDLTGDIDQSYMDFNLDIYEIKYIVLYATQDLFLIKMISKYEEEYALINSKYTLDGNYEFFGPVYEEYRNMNKVYKEILEQVNGCNKGKGRK